LIINSNKFKGSELFYNKIEKILESFYEVKPFTIKENIQICKNYKNVEFGSKEFLAKTLYLI
jgi:hypothetical protein